jgi:hypothetical protein
MSDVAVLLTDLVASVLAQRGNANDRMREQAAMTITQIRSVSAVVPGEPMSRYFVPISRTVFPIYRTVHAGHSSRPGSY